jgi:hypothetical protein
VTFFNITDPFNMEATPEPENPNSPSAKDTPGLEKTESERFAQMPFDEAPGLEALSAAATSNYGYIRPLSNPPHSPGGTIITHPPSNNLNFILNPDPEGALGMHIYKIRIITCTNSHFKAPTDHI